VANNRFTSYVLNLWPFFLSSSSSSCVCIGPFSLGLHFVTLPSSLSRVEITTPSSARSGVELRRVALIHARNEWNDIERPPVYRSDESLTWHETRLPRVAFVLGSSKFPNLLRDAGELASMLRSPQSNKFVSHPRDGDDQFGMFGILLQLLTKGVHMNIHSPRKCSAVITPNGLQ